MRQKDMTEQTEKPVMDEGKAFIGTTPAGKKLQLCIKNGTQFMEFSFTDGGELPKSLKGLWNDFEAAVATAKQYLAEMEAKHRAAQSIKVKEEIK